LKEIELPAVHIKAIRAHPFAADFTREIIRPALPE